MNTSWSDEDSKDSQNKEEDLVGNVAFASYLSNKSCSLTQKKTDYVATKTAHCYNNKISVRKKCDNLTESYSKNNGGSEFDDNDLKDVYQQTYSQWLKVRKENQYLISRVDILVNGFLSLNLNHSYFQDNNHLL